MKTTALRERSNPHSDLESQDPRNEEPGSPAATVMETGSVNGPSSRVCCRPKMSPHLGCTPSGSDCDGGVGGTIQGPLTLNYPLLAGPGEKSPGLRATVKFHFVRKKIKVLQSIPPLVQYIKHYKVLAKHLFNRIFFKKNTLFLLSSLSCYFSLLAMHLEHLFYFLLFR